MVKTSMFREFGLLDFINPYICELDGTLAINGKIYFIILIDNCNYEN